ncbi:MAG: 4Fe-4S dicluster domain-containing protein [Thermodesulfobacteriota bacterium]|nr:4Fe-4S dicluster domain-containing protein [Thermodesulfobacteriota bacterium]
MVFNLLFYISFIIFIFGLIYKVSIWFSRKIGILAKDISTSRRVFSAVRGIFGVFFSSKILTIVKVFILDVLLQRRILKEDFLRWLMHMLMFYGFMLLLLMHGLDDIITGSIFKEYYSTLNPYFFLRDLFGVMVIAGLGIAVYRRLIQKVPRLKTNGMDYYAIIILAVIMISGLLLEGVKITSYTEFQDMVTEWSSLDDEEEIRALESLWVQDFGVVSPDVKGPFERAVLKQGRDVHETNCAGCHSSNKWAFSGYSVGRIISPVALMLDRAGISVLLWYIHFISCFFGLAYLPFSKMFHIFAGPVSLLANSVMEQEKSDPANIATRQAMEVDACTHCCACSLRCSALMAFEASGNECILPSEKMYLLKALIAGKDLGRREIKAVQQGVYLCTNCDRCTVVCPVGINLKELWVNVRENLLQRGEPEPLLLSPFSFVRGLNRENLSEDEYSGPIETARQAVAGSFDLLMEKERLLSLKGRDAGELKELAIDNAFIYCFGCQNCTTVCPVVRSFDKPEKELGLLPHQIMCCLGLGLVEMASGSRMIWDCVTCYQCQEHCPQNVEVTDLLFQLKNLAIKNLEKAGTR